MGTILQIYKVGSLDYAKNMIIEDIESYLANKGSLYYADSKYQYLPLSYTKTIKIDLSKSSFSPYNAKNSASIVPSVGDYVKTINQANADAESFVAYYYITNATWTAEKTALLTLTLDVLNTFYGSFASKFSARTRTTRQHKDRFWNRSFGSGYYVRRFYDTNEGFNPSKFLTNKLYWNDPDSYGLTGETQKFYLIDKTPSKTEQEAVNKVVNSYLTFDNEPSTRNFVIASAYNSFASVLQNVSTSDIVVIDAVNNPTMSYINPSTQEIQPLQYSTNKLFFIILYYEDNTWKLGGWVLSKTTAFDFYRVVIYNQTISNPQEWLVNNCQFIHIEANSNIQTFINNHRTISAIASTTQTSGTATNVVADYSVIDPCDFTINNIFVLPYSPINLDIQYLLGNYVIKNEDVNVDIPNSYLLRLKDNTDFSRSWTFNGTSIAPQYLDIIYENNLIVKIADVSYIELESRLYGSEFFNWGIWFAGQQVLINNEKFRFTETSTPSQLPVFKLNYKVSNSFSGHFLFKIEWIDSWDKYGGLNDPEDLVLFVSKDNRNVLYQNNYLDYRKTMQQFDKQALAIAQSQSWFNVGSSIANSLLMSAIGSQSSGAVQRTIGLASSISASLGNAIFAQINNENSLRQKEASLAAQRTSIRAGADVDLQNAINGNKLYFVRYSASDELKKNLYQYFKYYGYACNDYGVPNLNSRRWWNYIECEADFDMSGLEVYAFYLAHIKEKLKQGCTIYHKYNNNWDLTQSNENREIWYTN